MNPGNDAMVKLDSNAAWNEAAALVAANRELFLVLAGVFFMLPSLARAVFVGEPELAPGMTADQVIAAMAAFYASAWWILALGMALQVVGMLAILTLMRDRTRPTVSQAIKAGTLGLLPFLGAQIVFFFGASFVGSLVIGAAAAVLPPLAAILVVLFGVFLLYATMRLVVIAPVVAVEGARNPLAVLRRSWTLTRGNFWRILGFLALVVVLFVVILAVIMLIVGVILALVSQGETQRVLAAATSSTLVALGMLYLIGIMAAIHGQLAGAKELQPEGRS